MIADNLCPLCFAAIGRDFSDAYNATSTAAATATTDDRVYGAISSGLSTPGTLLINKQINVCHGLIATITSVCLYASFREMGY